MNHVVTKLLRMSTLTLMGLAAVGCAHAGAGVYWQSGGYYEPPPVVVLPPPPPPVVVYPRVYAPAPYYYTPPPVYVPPPPSYGYRGYGYGYRPPQPSYYGQSRITHVQPGPWQHRR